MTTETQEYFDAIKSRYQQQDNETLTTKYQRSDLSAAAYRALAELLTERGIALPERSENPDNKREIDKEKRFRNQQFFLIISLFCIGLMSTWYYLHTVEEEEQNRLPEEYFDEYASEYDVQDPPPIKNTLQ